MINGILNVYKEEGYTSFDVVARLRGIFGQKKIGHAGTLDPMAEGVLAVMLGKATKLSDMLSASDKVYEAVLRLGFDTDTYDRTGKVVLRDEKERIPSVEEIQEAFHHFTGTQQQTPPIYSAVKVSGKRAYEYARKGESLTLKSREIRISRIELISCDYPLIAFRVSCSSGTYIRSLCQDLSHYLGTCGCMEKLTRIYACGMRAEDGYRLQDLEELKNTGKLREAVRPMDSLFPKAPAVNMKADRVRFLLNGNKLTPDDFSEADTIRSDASYFSSPFIVVKKEGEMAALYRGDPNGQEFVCYKMLV